MDRGAAARAREDILTLLLHRHGRRNGVSKAMNCVNIMTTSMNHLLQIAVVIYANRMRNENPFFHGARNCQMNDNN
jgi:hypothetical protein